MLLVWNALTPKIELNTFSPIESKETYTKPPDYITDERNVVSEHQNKF